MPEESIVIVETIKNIGSIAGTVISCVTLVTLIVKPIRNKVIEFIKKHSGSSESDEKVKELRESIDKLNSNMTILADGINEYMEKDAQAKKDIITRLDTLEEGNCVMIGNHIRDIYIRYKESKHIPEKEFEAMSRLYKIYTEEYHGNGIIKRIYNEVTSDEWHIDVE